MDSMNTEEPITKTFTISNEYGIHARPAALFVKCASRFRCDVKIGKDSLFVSGKSIMGLLTLEAHQGSQIEIAAVGEDAQDAMEALAELVEGNFGE